MGRFTEKHTKELPRQTDGLGPGETVAPREVSAMGKMSTQNRASRGQGCRVRREGAEREKEERMESKKERVRGSKRVRGEERRERRVRGVRGVRAREQESEEGPNSPS